MSIIEIEKEIKPLSREEKEKLFQFLAEELGKDDLLAFFTPGAEYPIFTPTITPDDSAYRAAEQIQSYLDEGKL